MIDAKDVITSAREINQMPEDEEAFTIVSLAENLASYTLALAGDCAPLLIMSILMKLTERIGEFEGIQDAEQETLGAIFAGVLREMKDYTRVA